MREPKDQYRESVAMRQTGQGEPILTEPFQRYAKLPKLRWPLENLYWHELVQLYYEDCRGEKIPPEMAKLLGKNAYYRLAYPAGGLDYVQAGDRALAGDDDSLLKLVRVFGYEVEGNDPILCEHFRARMKKAHEERDFQFLRRYNTARRSPAPDRTHKQHTSRLFLLTIFEPFLRPQKNTEIMAFLQKCHDIGRLPKKQLPTLDSLRQQLFQLGWKKR